MNYKVRQARLDDAEHLEQYIRGIIGEDLPGLYSKAAPPSHDEIVAFIDAHSNPKASLLIIAVADGRMVGMLDAGIQKHPQRSHCAEFGMSVSSEHRRQGVGTALLNELFLWSETHQLKRLELEVFSNNLAALKLYEKVGFSVEGIQKEAVRVGSEYVDLVNMARFQA